MSNVRMPSEVTADQGLFDRFAGWTSHQAARAPFFALCLGLILVWPVCFFVLNADTAQLIINTATTIVTFLLVALLQNSQHRADAAIQHKLNAIADALGDLMDLTPELGSDQIELRAAVGVEDRESSSD